MEGRRLPHTYGAAEALYGGVREDDDNINDFPDSAKAAWLVADAMVGRDASQASMSKRLYRLYLAYENMVYPERAICVLLLVAVSFVEVPLWCLERRSGVWAFQDPEVLCAAAVPAGHASSSSSSSLSSSVLLLSGIRYVPVGWTLLVEAGSVAYLAALAAMEAVLTRHHSREGPRRLEGRFVVRAVFVALAVADLAVFAALVCLAGRSPGFRLAPYCRVALLVVSVDAIAESAAATFAMLDAFANVAVLWLSSIFFVGWLSAMLFDDWKASTGGGDDDAPTGNEGFGGFGESLNTVFFLGTTSTIPDGYIGVYTRRRAFGLFFVAYIIICVFVFVNLILTVIYDAYSDFCKALVVERYANRARGLAAAFRLAARGAALKDGRPCVSQGDFADLCRHLCQLERVPRISKETVAFFFRLMDEDGSKTLDASEFYDICDVLQYSFKRISTTTVVQRRCPKFAVGPTFAVMKRCVASPRFEDTVTTALVLNSALVLATSWLDLTDRDTRFTSNALGTVSGAFSGFYMGALGLELAVVPLDEFWLSASNRFDLFSSTLLFVTSVYWALPCTNVGPDLVHYLGILRLLRLLNLVGNIHRYRAVAQCITRVIPASTGIIGLLFASTALWSAAGCQLFGGLIHGGNARLAGSAYLDAHYEVLNFNDFAMGFMPLFAMLASGGPSKVVVDAFNAVSRWALAGSAFFFSYYVVGVLVLVNVFSAFIITAFVSQYDGKLHSDQVGCFDEDAEDGYRIIAIRGSHTEDVYKAMFAQDLKDAHAKHSGLYDRQTGASGAAISDY